MKRPMTMGIPSHVNDVQSPMAARGNISHYDLMPTIQDFGWIWLHDRSPYLYVHNSQQKKTLAKLFASWFNMFLNNIK